MRETEKKRERDIYIYRERERERLTECPSWGTRSDPPPNIIKNGFVARALAPALLLPASDA